MPVGTQGQTKVSTPRSLTIVAASEAALQTAVDAQTNTLNKGLVSPYSGQQTGNVLNGSIVVSPTNTAVANNVISFLCTVLWTEFRVIS